MATKGEVTEVPTLPFHEEKDDDDESSLNPDNEKTYDVSQTKISDSESGPCKRRQRPFCDNLREYLENTSLHGFRYILDKRSTWIERCWWVCMVITSMTACSFFIWKVWDQWDKTPVIVSFADTSNSAWTIPFPAVTVCTETKPRQRMFNFTKAHEKNRKSNISLEDSKTYYDMLLVCNNPHSEGPTYADASSFETIRKLAPSLNDVFLKCMWKDLECSNLFYHTLTKDGYCFTFNMLSEEQLFKTENLHKDYSHVGTKNHSSWSLERGYPNPPKVNTYPLRGPSYGGVEFEVILATDKRDMDLLCRGPVQGFKVWLHSPAELPNMGQNFFRLPIQFQSAASITPIVIKTSDGLKNYSPDKRRCYFPDEKYLRFFRTYTQRNCELECASNFTAATCGCVPLYMPHGTETKVCGGGQQSCIIEAFEKHSLDKSSLTLKKDEMSATESQCGCLQACLELSYEAEVSQAVYNITNYNELGNHLDSDIANGWRVPSGLVLYFGSEQFTSLRRSELYGGVSFLANCGGILGLFMGFSFLSLAEILYYFTIRLWRRVIESRRATEEEN